MKAFFSALLISAYIPVSVLGGQNLSVRAPTSHIGDVRRLPMNQLTQPATIKLRGVVTAFSGWKNSFFLQDSSGGISVDRNENTDVQVGNEVEVTGTIR